MMRLHEQVWCVALIMRQCMGVLGVATIVIQISKPSIILCLNTELSRVADQEKQMLIGTVGCFVERGVMMRTGGNRRDIRPVLWTILELLVIFMLGWLWMWVVASV